MNTHFEHLWNRSELTAKELDLTENESQNQLLKILSTGAVIDEVDFGIILFHLSNLARIYNVNVYTALQYAMEDAKVSQLDP